MVVNVSGGRTSPKGFPAFLRALAALIVTAVIVAGCGEDEPEPTVEELLAVIEGRTLTSAEVAQKVDVGETLCQLDDPVLDAVWQQLSEEQLEFQDFVVAQLCPDRSIFYAGLTGRYVTEEAENSGIVPSTTTEPAATVTGPSGSQATTSEPSETEASDLNSPDPNAPDPDSPELELTPTSGLTPGNTVRGSITPLDEPAPSGQIGPTTVPSSPDAGE